MKVQCLPVEDTRAELEQAKLNIRHCSRVIASLNAVYRGAGLLPPDAIDFAITKADAEIRLIGKF